MESIFGAKQGFAAKLDCFDAKWSFGSKWGVLVQNEVPDETRDQK